MNRNQIGAKARLSTHKIEPAMREMCSPKLRFVEGARFAEIV